MSKYRVPAQNNPYYLPKETYLTALHWCLQYPNWKAELELDPDTSKAITYDQDRVQTSGDYDPTMETAMRRNELANKVRMLEDTIHEVDDSEGVMFQYLLKGVGHGFTEHQLRDCGMPCGHNKYYRMRQHIYYLVSQKI